MLVSLVISTPFQILVLNPSYPRTLKVNLYLVVAPPALRMHQ